MRVPKAVLLLSATSLLVGAAAWSPVPGVAARARMPHLMGGMVAEIIVTH